MNLGAWSGQKLVTFPFGAAPTLLVLLSAAVAIVAPFEIASPTLLSNIETSWRRTVEPAPVALTAVPLLISSEWTTLMTAAPPDVVIPAVAAFRMKEFRIEMKTALLRAATP